MGRKSGYVSPSKRMKNIKRLQSFIISKQTIRSTPTQLSVSHLEIIDIRPSFKTDFKLKVSTIQSVDIPPDSDVKQISIDPVHHKKLSYSLPIKTTYPHACEVCSTFQCSCSIPSLSMTDITHALQAALQEQQEEFKKLLIGRFDSLYNNQPP